MTLEGSIELKGHLMVVPESASMEEVEIILDPPSDHEAEDDDFGPTEFKWLSDKLWSRRRENNIPTEDEFNRLLRYKSELVFPKKGEVIMETTTFKEWGEVFGSNPKPIVQKSIMDSEYAEEVERFPIGRA
ncbi:unnamed protein product [Calypogeia fissa]